MRIAWFRRTVAATAVVYGIALLATLSVVWQRVGVARIKGWGCASTEHPTLVTWVLPGTPAAGVLQPGDRILSIDGESRYRGLFGPGQQIWSYPPGRTYHVKFLRAGIAREADLQITSRPDRSKIPLIVSFLFGSLTFFSTAFLLGWQRPDLRTARIGWMASLLTAFVYLGLMLEVISSLGWEPTVLKWILIWPDRVNLWFAWCFAAEFPVAAAFSPFWRRVRIGLAVLCAAVWLNLALGHLPLVIRPWQRQIRTALPAWWFQVGDYLYWAYLACIAVAMVGVVVRNYRAARDPGVRRRIELVAGAVLAGTAGMVAGNLVGAWQGEIQPWRNLAPLPIPICFAYAVVKHRVLDLRLAVRRSLQYLLARQLLRALTLAPLIVLVVRVWRNPAAPAGSLGNLACIALVAAAMLALEFRDRILAAVDRWFLRETLDREKHIRVLLAELSRTDSWEGVVDLATTRLAALFGAESVEVSAVEEDSPAREKAPDAAFPIAAPHGRVLGLLRMGPKRSEEAYTATERELLALVAAQMGLVADNLLLATERFEAVVSERKRIAREVHDTAGHGFAGISLYLEAARKSLRRSPEEAAQYLEEARTIAKQSLQATRDSVAAMRAPSGLDLEARLRSLADASGAGPSISVRIANGVCRAASPDVQWHLARIAEEAVTNARKHASAREIQIDLEAQDSTLLLRVHDDGSGFDMRARAARGYGLAGMRERAGEMRGHIDIASAPGKGTEVRVSVPAALSTVGETA